MRARMNVIQLEPAQSTRCRRAMQTKRERSNELQVGRGRRGECVCACESVSSRQLSTKVLTLRRLCFRAEPIFLTIQRLVCRLPWHKWRLHSSHSSAWLAAPWGSWGGEAARPSAQHYKENHLLEPIGGVRRPSCILAACEARASRPWGSVGVPVSGAFWRFQRGEGKLGREALGQGCGIRSQVQKLGR